MGIWDGLIVSWQALQANKLRSVLTILSIVIGVSAVVFVISYGRTQEQNMLAVFERMGANAIYIRSSPEKALERPEGTLTVEDANALINHNPASTLVKAAPYTSKVLNVVCGNQKKIINIIGATAEIQEVLNYDLAYGEFFSEQQLKRGAAVALLGDQAVKELFGTKNPIGESIRINGRQFDIIGVFEKKGGGRSTWADKYIIIPLTTMQSKFVGTTSARGRPVQTIAVKAASLSEIKNARAQITSVLRERHHLPQGKDDDFMVTDMQEMIKRRLQMAALLQGFLTTAAVVSLVVGGIGIMNIMLVSVTERTREIGIRKSIGAKRKDILSQFLLEASVLCLGGGIMGVALAAIVAQLVKGQNMGPSNMNVTISPDVIIIALTVAIFTGLISGTYPALRAARLDPVESLRQE